MYDELYAAWRFDLENTALGGLPSDFYARAADYLRSIDKEARMMDKKDLKSTLLEHELLRVKCMLKELIWTRYKKLVSIIKESKKLPSDFLTDEEESLCRSYLSFTESYQKFADNLLRCQVSAQVPEIPAKKVRKRVALRFLKAVPAVIGADMNTYGPFLAEDVASLPVENAKILVKQGLAEKIELP